VSRVHILKLYGDSISVWLVLARLNGKFNKHRVKITFSSVIPSG